MTAPLANDFKDIRNEAFWCRSMVREAGLEDSEVRDMVWESAKRVRDAAKSILQISGDPRDTASHEQTLDEEDVKSMYELIEDTARDMELHGTGDTYPIACRKIIKATRKIEELLQSLLPLDLAVVSGQNASQIQFVPHNEDPPSEAAYTRPTGATPHPQPAFMSATTEDREAEASNLPEDVVGGDEEKLLQKLEHSLLELRSNLPNTDNPQIAAALTQLGVFHMPTGDWTQAKDLLEESLQMLLDLHGDQPHEHTAASLFSLGMLNVVQGNRTQAGNYLQKSLRMFQSLSGGAPKSLNGIYSSYLFLGKLAVAQHDLIKAKAYFRESLQTAHSLCASLEDGAGHILVAMSLLHLGQLNLIERDLDDAKVHLEEASTLILSTHGDQDDLPLAALLGCQGRLSLMEGDLLLAKVRLEESLRKFQAVHGDKDHLDFIETLCFLGLLNLVEGDLEKAQTHLEKSRRMSISLFGDQDHGASALVFLFLGKWASASGDQMQARDYFERSLQMNLRVLGDRDPPHPLIAETMFLLGQLSP